MNYLIQFPLPHPITALRFLGPNNTITDRLTEALVCQTAQVAGIYLDNYMAIFTDSYSIAVIIRPTNLDSLPSQPYKSI